MPRSRLSVLWRQPREQLIRRIVRSRQNVQLFWSKEGNNPGLLWHHRSAHGTFWSSTNRAARSGSNRKAAIRNQSAECRRPKPDIPAITRLQNEESSKYALASVTSLSAS